MTPRFGSKPAVDVAIAAGSKNEAGFVENVGVMLQWC